MLLSDFEKMMLTLNILSSLIIVYKGLFHVINQMTKQTRFSLRLAWAIMTTGALAVVVGPVFGLYLIGTYTTLIHIGLALFILSERRTPGFPNV